MSIWKKDNYKNEVLNKDIKVNTLIIGGGLTGLLTAFNLNDETSCVVEARTIGSGVTKNTTAKITYLQENIHTKISSLVGKKKANFYLKSQIESVNNLVNLIKENNVDCNLEKTPSYIFAHTKKEIKKLKKEVKFLEDNKVNIISSPLPSNIKSYLSYKVCDTYTFNPLKFLTGIYNILRTKNISVYEHTKIVKIKKENDTYTCITENSNKIIAKNVIFATNYPHFLFPMLIELKSSCEKSYIIVSNTPVYKNYSMINVGKNICSGRYYKDKSGIYKISLGASHNIAYKNNDKKCFDKVKKEFNLSEKNIIMKYSNTDLITMDHMPFIGKIKENMYIAAGYNTWGMTNSILASNVLKDLIENKENEYVSLFNPKRINIALILKLPIYIFMQTKSFISSKILKNKSWYKENPSTNYIVGSAVSTYTDDFGVEHKVKNKCPHLGCGLIFNEEELTWDCPCHSSRFDIDGNCIKGPSNKDIKL